MLNRHHVGQLVRDCMRGQAWRDPTLGLHGQLGRHVHPSLTSAAVFHGGAAYVHEAFLRLPHVDVEARSQLAAAHHRDVRNQLRALSDLRVLAPLFDQAGIPWLLVKGPIVAAAHERADLRPYVDLDIVVPPTLFPKALRVLEKAGAVTDHIPWQLLFEQEAGEVALRLPSGGTIDLHWHLLNEAAFRSTFAVPIEAILARARRVTLDGVEIPTPDPVDALLHLCLHAAASGGNRLMWYKDLERWLMVHDIDWGAVRERAEEWRLGLVSGVVLTKAVALMGAPVPIEVLRMLPPARGWTDLTRLTSLLSSTEAARGRPSLERIVSRATRVDTGSSLRELARRFGRGACNRMPFRLPAEVSEDPSEQSSMRDSYLEQVVMQGS